MTEPLTGQANRQATPALRGYHYQILHTIHAWLDLDEGDRLYLEGAEDFDCVSDAEAQATQVKHSDTRDAVTLRVPAVVAAIDSYWSLRHRNPGHAIRLNFLTTADIGVEAGEPFGTHQAGLDLWMQATRTLADEPTVAITRFLIDEGRVSSEVRDFLKTATPVEARAQLLIPLTWSSRAPGIGDVEEGLLSRLRALCVQRRIPPAWAEKVRDRLLSAAWAAAIQPTADLRVLTREDFERCFLEAETVTVPISGLPQALSDLIAKTLASFVPAGSGIALAVAAGGSRLTTPPPLLGNRLARKPLQSHILEVLRRKSLVQLQGSSGLGKTILASMVAAALPATCLWVNCRGIDHPQLRLVFDELNGRLESASSPLQYIVLDDVDVIEHFRILEESLPGILYVLRRRGGGLVLTSDRKAPQRLLGKLGVATDCIVPVPAFDDDEVGELLKSAGLADEALRGGWAKIIWAKTSGHPQLVTAHIANLVRNRFPRLSLDDLASVPPEIKDEHEAVRLLLRHEMPIDQRELLYRLSAVAGSFDRPRALALAQWEVPIPQSGDVFDALVGPWIEHLAESRYRLSPLLAGAGGDANGPEWLKAMHSAIAWTWLKFKQQTPWDIATILASATLAQDFDAIARLAIGLFKATDDQWKAVAEASLLFLHFYTNKGQPFPGDLMQCFYFRYLQLQLVMHGSAESLAKILDRIEEDFSPDETHPRAVVLGYVLRLQALAHGREHLRARQLIRLVQGMDRDSTAVFNELRRVGGSVKAEAMPAVAADQSTRMLGVQLTRTVTTVAALEDTIAALGELEPSLRARCLVSFREMPDMGRQWADALWLTEEQKSEPQWELLTRALRDLYTQAISWGEVTLGQAVASVLARVLRENLSDTDEALAVLAAAPDAGDARYLLLDARAKILLQIGKRAEALALWHEVLEQWPLDVTGNIVGFAIAARNAGYCAARVEDWAQASELFARAAVPGLELLDARLTCGLLADAAHAAWHSGNATRAIALAQNAIQGLESIPNSPEDLRSYYLHKSIGHLMTWMATDHQQSPSTWHEPDPGTCSSLDPPKKVTEYTPTPLAVTQLNFVIAAHHGGLSLQPFQSLINFLRAVPYPLVRANLAQLLMDVSIEEGAVTDFVSDLVLRLNSTSLAEQQKTAGVANWLPYNPVPGRGDIVDVSATLPELWELEFCRALFSLAAHRISMGSAVLAWHGAAVTVGAPQAVIQWLKELLRLENSSALAVWEVLRDGNAHWSSRLGAMSILLGRRAIDPLLILWAHLHALMFADMGLAKWMEAVVCRALAQAWREACLRPVTLSRTEGIPALLSTCDESPESWSKAGRMFLAAVYVLDADVPNEGIERAKGLAGT